MLSGTLTSWGLPPPPGGRGVQEKVISSGLVLPPNRSFGLAFALIFAIGATAAWLNNFLPLAIVSMSASVIFGLAGLVAPGFLRPVNWAWMYIGYILGKLTGPLVTGFLFFGLISPLALFLRIIGRDELLVHSFRSASSSWKPPLGGGDTNFERQF